MTLHVFGSINIDHAYRPARFPKSGETLASNAYVAGLSGEGANEARATDFKSDPTVHDSRALALVGPCAQGAFA